jgi:hypothetical protein
VPWSAPPRDAASRSRTRPSLVVKATIALLVYTTENTIWLSGSGALCRGASTISLLAPLAGLILCALVGATVHEFTQHVSRNWMRATRCKELVPDLHWLVEEEGGAPPPDLTGGWPGYLKSYAGFAAYKPPAGPRRRLQGLLLLYPWRPWILGALFAAIRLLAGGRDARPAARLAGAPALGRRSGCPSGGAAAKAGSAAQAASIARIRGSGSRSTSHRRAL